MAPITVGYWKIRGLAQPIRMILGYNKANFEDVLYECGDAPNYDRSSFNNVKYSLGLDFPNLPYLIDGDVKITQSNAILRYLGRKFNMMAETPEEHVRMDMIENQAMDFRNGVVALVYRSKPQLFAQKCKEYAEKIKTMLGMFDKFIGDNAFFVGSKITFVDFIMYELLDQHRLMSAKFIEDGTISVGMLDGFDNLNRFLKKFEEIPIIKEFMESDKCFKGAVNNKSALFK